jgi:hypothetical protein
VITGSDHRQGSPGGGVLLQQRPKHESTCRPLVKAYCTYLWATLTNISDDMVRVVHLLFKSIKVNHSILLQRAELQRKEEEEKRRKEMERQQREELLMAARQQKKEAICLWRRNKIEVGCRV